MSYIFTNLFFIEKLVDIYHENFAQKNIDFSHNLEMLFFLNKMFYFKIIDDRKIFFLFVHKSVRPTHLDFALLF